MNGVVRLVTMLAVVTLAGVAAFAISPSPPYSGERAGVRGRTSEHADRATLAAGQRPARPLSIELARTTEDAQVVDLRQTTVAEEGAGTTRQAVLAQIDPVRFQTVDVYVDAGDKPLAAYQFSLHAAARNALLSGLEGGEHPAYARPPYYDPKALIDETVIVAGLSTADDLPRGRTRVARLHVQVTGAGDPRYEAKLHAAAGPDGAALDAKVTVEAR